MPLQEVYSFTRVGGVGSITGGQGEIVPLPGRLPDGSLDPFAAEGAVVASAGDMLVMTFNAALLNDGTGVDEAGFSLPIDGRSWTSFMAYINPDSPAPFALSLATMLTDNFVGVPVQYGGGFLGFLDEGYGMSLWRGVASILGADLQLSPKADEVTFGGTDLEHPYVVPREANLALLGGIGHRVGSIVTGFPSGDLTGVWGGGQLVYAGFNAARVVSWVAPSKGYQWQENADPGSSLWIPEGRFAGSGSAPSMTVGVLYLDLLSTVHPVTRQFPRDDAYGLIGGTRVYPPPRVGRVFGGQQ